MDDAHYKIMLESFVRNRYIFIDTCSLMVEPGIIEFWKSIVPFLWKYKHKVFIPVACYHELEKHANDLDDQSKSEKARKAINLVDRLRNNGYVELGGEEKDDFADSVFQYVFVRYRLNHKLLLITQDNTLAREIERLNSSVSVKSHNKIIVNRIRKDGRLSKFYWQERTTDVQ